MCHYRHTRRYIKLTVGQVSRLITTSLRNPNASKEAGLKQNASEPSQWQVQSTVAMLPVSCSEACHAVSVGKPNTTLISNCCKYAHGVNPSDYQNPWPGRQVQRVLRRTSPHLCSFDRKLPFSSGTLTREKAGSVRLHGSVPVLAWCKVRGAVRYCHLQLTSERPFASETLRQPAGLL